MDLGEVLGGRRRMLGADGVPGCPGKRPIVAGEDLLGNLLKDARIASGWFWKPGGDGAEGHAREEPEGDRAEGHAREKPGGDGAKGDAREKPPGDGAEGDAREKPGGDGAEEDAREIGGARSGGRRLAREVALPGRISLVRSGARQEAALPGRILFGRPAACPGGGRTREDLAREVGSSLGGGLAREENQEREEDNQGKEEKWREDKIHPKPPRLGGANIQCSLWFSQVDPMVLTPTPLMIRTCGGSLELALTGALA